MNKASFFIFRVNVVINTLRKQRREDIKKF